MVPEFQTTLKDHHAAMQEHHQSKWWSRTAVRGTLFIAVVVFLHAIILGADSHPNDLFKLLYVSTERPAPHLR
jgi:hypothetical protein